jgi:hypothetical protein
MPEFIADDRPGAPRPEAVKRPQHDETYLKTVYRCGERREHVVRIHRSKWPPPKNPSINDRPYLVANCERCGAVCIVYADPVPADMTVRLYGEAGEREGRVEDEGQVVDEASVGETAGQVLEEEPPKRRRRSS